MEFQAIRAAHARFLSAPRLPLLVLLGAAILIRVLMSVGTNGILWPDSFAYYRSGALMAVHGNFHWHEIYRTPLYPFFLSWFMYLFGQNELSGFITIVAQRLLGIGAIWLFYIVARKNFGPTVAFYGALLFALHTLQLYYETVVQTEILFVFLLYVLLYVCDRFFREDSAKDAVLIGLTCGLLTLARPLGQFVVLVVLMAYFWQRGFSKRSLGRAAIALAVTFLTLFPWMMTNKVYYRFFGVSQDLGLNLFHRIIDVDRIEPRSDTAYPRVKNMWEQVRDQRHVSYFLVYHGLIRSGMRPLRADRQMAKFAIETLKEDPLPFLKNIPIVFYRNFFDARKSVQFCGAEGGPYMCTKNTLGQRRKSFANDPSGTTPGARSLVYDYFKAFELPFATISTFAFIGMPLLLWRLGRRNPMSALFVLLIMYSAALTAIFNIPEDRFRLPTDPLIFACAVYGLLAVLEFCAQRLKRRHENSLPKTESSPAL